MSKRHPLLALSLVAAVATAPLAAQAPAQAPAQPPAQLPAQPPAQDPEQAAMEAAAAQAIREWADDFEHGRIGLQGSLKAGAPSAYVGTARRAGLLRPQDEERLVHFDVLQKLLFFAESHPSAAMADALLDVAAVRLESSFLDFAALQLRDLGHWALMRMQHQGVWFLILRAAAGERLPLFGVGKEAGEGPPAGPGRRVAALRLLGMKGLPVFRSTVEGALRDPDPRVRLAAAEAVDQQHRPESLPALRAALMDERHPVAAQAMVRALTVILKTAGERIDEAQRREAIAAALEQFGMAGWRTDMDLLGLVEAWPHRDAVPVLLRALELAAAPADPLLLAVNKRASPLLRERAAQLLRAMTGALLPANDPAAWRKFWASEGDKIVVPAVLPQNRPQTTKAQFFGVPVTGGSIAFVVDTSGSMDEVVGTNPREEKRGVGPTRLRAAKEQMLAAVQGMDPDSCYWLWTFADKAHQWTPVPIRPSASSGRSLTELLGRLHAKGGTNLYDGLAQALQFAEMKLGEQNQVRVDEVFVLSDGEPTAGEVREPEELLTVVREANRYAKVRIHTIFTGSGHGSDLLRRLAEENGGVYVQR